MNIASINKRATTILVNPVLPPADIPVVLSIYAVTVDVPKSAPAVVEIASDNKACLALGSFPFFMRPAGSLTPINVPTVSNKSRNRKMKITVSSSGFAKTSGISSLKSVASSEGGAAKTPLNSINPIIIPETAVTRNPINIAPLILRARRIAITSKPKIDNRVGVDVMSPSVTYVTG